MPLTTIKATEKRLVQRSVLPLKPTSVDEKARTVRAICTTEKPAQVLDYERGIITEVLLMSGCVLPDSGKVTLLNGHRQGLVDNVLGSAYDFAFGEEDFSGTRYGFLEATVEIDPTEEGAWSKLKHGHCDRFSVGYYPLEYIWVKAGESIKIEKKTYEGGKDGLQITTKWSLAELSQVPIPADENATARASTNTGNEPATTADITLIPERKEEIMPNEKETPVVVDVKAAIDAALNGERARVADITEACKAAGIDAGEMLAKGISADEARKEIIKAMAGKSQPVGRVELVADAKDKLTKAAAAGIATALGVKSANVPGQEMFQHSILRTAEEILSAGGLNTRAMRKDEIVARALTSADFTHIFGTAANQALGAVYASATDNFSAWVNEIDVPDYRTIDAMNLSAGGDLDEIVEGAEVPLATPADEGETYRVSPKAKRLVLSRQIMLGDNMGAFKRLLDSWTIKAKNGLNKAVFGILNTNAAMSDGIALFHADHDNLPTGAALSASSLAAAWGNFRQIPDADGNPMNQAPAFLVVSSDYEFTALQLCTSATIAGSNGELNPFKGKLQVISDANLTAATWYLAGAKGISDTIQVAYLNGKRIPELLEQPKISVLGVEYVIVFDYGTKAVSFRSLLKGK